MKIAYLGTFSSNNIGDEIQSIAVKQHIKDNNFIVLDRENLNIYDGDECILVTNGWFQNFPENFPFNKKIHPIFFGFHIAEKSIPFYKNYISYFKKYEPIGSRDFETSNILKSWGVRSYVSGCATMTFKNRLSGSQQNKIFLVDIDQKTLKIDALDDKIIKNSHQLGVKYIPPEIKIAIAEKLIDFYRDNASYVITSRIHCAMPCFAMGIPTIYCGINNYRTSVVDMVGIPKMTLSRWRKRTLKSLHFVKPNYEELKDKITEDLKSKLKSHGVSTKD